jgi:Big-like domain-containing protein
MKEHRALFAVLVAGTLLLGALACEDSDKIPPEDSTISLAASPATILLSNGVQADGSDVTILATVYNGIGVPLPGQDVRFTMNSGVLTPTAGTPVRTDSIGNAVTVLTGATSTTTITAKSGKATADLQLQTTTCNISTVDLDPLILNFTSCDSSEPEGKVTLTATVTDTKGEPCAGLTVSFTADPEPEQDDVTISISPATVRTTAAGVATTTVTLGTDCDSKCHATDCNVSDRTITASAGATDSDPATINITIP